MATKLRQNMPTSYTLLISDVNEKALDQFVNQHSQQSQQGSQQRKVRIAQNVRELATESVSLSFTLLLQPKAALT